MESRSLLTRRRLLAGSAALLGLSAQARGEDREAARFFRIGTGGSAGTYFPIGTLVAEILNGGICAPPSCGIDGRQAVAELSNGSTGNCTALRTGSIDAGLVQSDILHNAWKGLDGFADAGPSAQLRFAATLYPEALHIVVAEAGKIRGVRDIVGRRIAVDEAASGSFVLVQSALAALGIKETDFQPRYLKPDFAIERMKAGALDGFVIVEAVPSALIAKFMSRFHARLVPITPDETRQIRRSYPYLQAGAIPAGIYAQGQADIPTLEVLAQLAVTTRLDARFVQKLLTQLWSDASLAQLRQRQNQIALAHALDGAGVPLHDGAERFYRDVGALK
ncbi:MAG TPA: TAXI family TRAP transporter solute-binding subunit [Aliidongia sp.]|nr:TAXI family TRAP transporter solute-binding subunit [Aliidongia sp.]